MVERLLRAMAGGLIALGLVLGAITLALMKALSDGLGGSLRLEEILAVALPGTASALALGFGIAATRRRR